MTLFRLGYVAMSVHVKNSSPSQTMSYKSFSNVEDEEAAIHKLEKIAKSNISNCFRLLIHNKANDIHFFRLSSRLVPLATHEKVRWDYKKALKDDFLKLGQYALEHQMRIDFHPDHFVVLNSPDKEILKTSILTLDHHYQLLKLMNIPTMHRCVFHLGGKYEDKEESLERFISNWAIVPNRIQQMIILENDDKTYTIEDILYVCEKLNIPFCFDLHHHIANHDDPDWIVHWARIVNTWNYSPLPMKMHISSPKSEHQFRAHADYINGEQFLSFAKKINHSVKQLDCMIEAKQKDDALFQLVNDLEQYSEVQMVDQASFTIND